MGKLTNIVIAAVVALVVAFGAVVMFKQEPIPALGGVNPDIPSAYLKWGSGGGVRVYPASQSFKVATTTLCSFQSPSATSTLIAAGVKVTLASTSATTLNISKSANITASTTAIGSAYAIGAGVPAFIQASTSPAAGAVTVFAPNTYLNVTLTGGDIGGLVGLAPTGVCHATFEEYVDL